ncbi:hypothetical protein [Oenococcus sp.]|uniref:hypothetical protein n=1 Tax=Oenococcus sp. TaxID=1979414 RepID=UPI0039EA9EC2
MAIYNLSIRYAGDGIKDGRIAVKNLAPSLMALSDSFQNLQRVVSPEEQPLSLDIKATKQGSFVVDLLLVNGTDIISKAIDMLSGKESEAFLSLVSYATIFFGSINFVKKSYKKKIKSTENIENNKVKIEFSDNTKITIPQDSLKVARDLEFRKSIKETYQPLDTDGLDHIEISTPNLDNTNMLVSVSSEELISFSVPEVSAEELETTVSDVYLQIKNVSFSEDNKWQFFDGENSFFARILDKDFIDRVQKNETQFGATDRLKVKLQREQKMTQSGLKNEYTVLRVLEHKRGPQQIELDFEN